MIVGVIVSVLASSEVDLYNIYTRDMMDCVLTSSEVDLGLPHYLQYLY
jgi:hypothetical protein